MPDDLATRQGPSLHLRAALQPATFDPESRTVDVVWTTGADVQRTDFWTGKRWIERLEVSPDAIDLSRLMAGAPVLNTHSSWALGDVVGVVDRAWIEDGKGYAGLRFSDRPEVADIIRDVQAGILRNISVGYTVEKWEVTEAGLGGAELRIAKRWTPMEVSLVPIPADPGAQVRSGPLPPPAAPPASKEPEMDPKTDPAVVAANETAVRAAAEQAAVEAQKGERQRIAALMTIQRQAGLDADWSERHIGAGTAADAARAEALEHVSQRATARISPAVQGGESGDDPAVMVRAMSDAMAARMGAGLAFDRLDAEQKLHPRHVEFRGLGLSDMLLMLAQARGEKVDVRHRRQLVERMFARTGGTLGTSDFPLLLASAGNKMLMAGFAAAAPSYRRIFAQRAFNDFKAHSFLMAGDFPAPTVLAEGAGIAAGSISEKREQITPATYARQVRLTRQALVNDDLGAFGDWGSMIGRRVADFENATAYALVNTASGAGPTLATDSTAVFAAGHANIAGSGGAISEATLDAGYAAIMAQTSLDSLKLNLMPRILLTGSAYRGAALRYTSRISPESGANVGLYSDLDPIADANVTGNRWYMFADPAAAPVYVYGYVGGAAGPQVRVHDPLPGYDAMAVEVVHDFAAGAVDYRGGYFNAGA